MVEQPKDHVFFKKYLTPISDEIARSSCSIIVNESRYNWLLEDRIDEHEISITIKRIRVRQNQHAQTCCIEGNKYVRIDQFV